MHLKTDIKPITHLKNHTAELVREVAATGRPVAITQNGEAKVVVLDVATYDRWRDAMALLRILAQGQEELDAGRVVSHDEAFARAEAEIDRIEADG